MSTATKRSKPETTVEEFLREVKARMAAREVSVSQLAHDTGLTRPYLSRLLNGRQEPSLVVAGKIADALGLAITTHVA